MSAQFPPIPPLDDEGLDVDQFARDAEPQDTPVHRPVAGTVGRHGATAAARAREFGQRAAGEAAWQAARLPRTLLGLVWRAPAGAWRILWALVLWVSDDEGRKVRRRMAAERPDAGSTEAMTYIRACAQHRETQWLRLRITGGLTGAALFAAFLASIYVPADLWPWLTWAAVAVAIVVCGAFGAPEPDVTVVENRTHRGGPPKLDSSLIVGALSTLGIGELNKALKADPSTVRFVSPIHRDGQGWRADIDLPGGVTAGDVVERRRALASGLRRPEGCVWPEPDADAHAGRLVLWVADRPMSTSTPVAWPLARTGRTNLFEPLPFGVDQRGRPVSITLMFAAAVIGAVPRQGKTAALRVLLLGAALDPRCELHVANCKGGGDLDPLAAVAHFIVSGDEPDDIDALLTDLRAIRADMSRRYKVMRELPRDIAPDSKVTDDLASRRELRLHPVVIGIDECQVIFEHDKHGKEFDEIVTDLVKRGPAVGISVIVATQRPDTKSLPSGIRSNAILRFCLRVTSQVETDMVLGTSAYKSGLRPTMFTRKDLGVGYLVGDGDDPTITRAAYVDTPTADVIAARARADRERRGLLSGMAAGDETESEPAPDLLGDVIDVWPANRGRLWWEEVAERLAERGHDLSPEAVSAALRGHGVPSLQVKRTVQGRQTNRMGCARADVEQALADR